jgi:tripartite-type tricarboxylate transporter receptor subunit TctC
MFLFQINYREFNMANFRIRSLVSLVVGAVTSFSASIAIAQVPPALAGKSVKIIVPQTAAGASDSISRLMAAELTKRWGISVIVENRPGAGGNIGSDAVAKSAPDGTTWLMSYSGTHAINPALYGKMPFDPKKDLAPLASLATLPFVLVINPQLPYKTLAEYVAYAKANPGKINVSSSGNGSVNHLLNEMLGTAAGIKTSHIPYKGAATALNDVMSGQVQAFYASAPSVMGQIKSGAVRPLAAAATKRAAALPDVPTFGEAGYPALSIDSWFAFFVQGATPQGLKAQIHSEINKVLADPAIVAQLSQRGAATMSTTLPAFQKIVDDDMETWGKTVRASGAKID